MSGDNMKVFWLFRTNLRQYEYYHSIDNLEQFKKQCHDFYLLMGIWMLENTELEEFVVWRLTPNGAPILKFSDRVFDVRGKRFIQRFTPFFDCCFDVKQFHQRMYYASEPDITLFRGGFPEYGKLTKSNPEFFGLKLYLGAGQRVYPKYGGIYNKILVEDERDMHPKFDCIPFYKTANPNIFYPMDLEKKWDICWPCNFAQLKYKGQEWFIKQIAKSDYLKSLKIVHLGNKPEEGVKLCRKYGVNNIDFKGWVTRPELNKYLNQSKIGLVTSNEKDGSPRVITEILCSGNVVAINTTTRLLPYFYTSYGMMALDVNHMTIPERIQDILSIELLKEVRETQPHHKEIISMRSVSQKNMELWNEF